MITSENHSRAFRKDLIMKYIMFFFLPICVWAQDQYQPSRIDLVYARGSASNYCQGGIGSSFCIDRIEERAEEDAKRQMELECRMKQGQLEYFISCSGYCSPFSIADGKNEYVSCSTNCQGRCEIP